MDDAGITTLPCGDAVEQVLRRLVAEIEGRGLHISAVVDHNGDAADAGLDIPDSKLVVFGQPTQSRLLMLADPVLALDLPMKILVWKRADGAVLLSFNATEFLAERHALDTEATTMLRIVEEIAEAAATS